MRHKGVPSPGLGDCIKGSDDKSYRHHGGVDVWR